MAIQLVCPECKRPVAVLRHEIVECSGWDDCPCGVRFNWHVHYAADVLYKKPKEATPDGKA